MPRPTSTAIAPFTGPPAPAQYLNNLFAAASTSAGAGGGFLSGGWGDEVSGGTPTVTSNLMVGGLPLSDDITTAEAQAAGSSCPAVWKIVLPVTGVCVSVRCPSKPYAFWESYTRSPLETPTARCPSDVLPACKPNPAYPFNWICPNGTVGLLIKTGQLVPYTSFYDLGGTLAKTNGMRSWADINISERKFTKGQTFPTYRNKNVTWRQTRLS